MRNRETSGQTSLIRPLILLGVVPGTHITSDSEQGAYDNCGCRVAGPGRVAPATRPLRSPITETQGPPLWYRPTASTYRRRIMGICIVTRGDYCTPIHTLERSHPSTISNTQTMISSHKDSPPLFSASHCHKDPQRFLGQGIHNASRSNLGIHTGLPHSPNKV